MSDNNSNKYEELAKSVLEEIGYVVDPISAEALYVNDKLLNLHGFTQEEAVGIKYFKLVCEGDEPCDYCKTFDLSKLEEDNYSKIYHYNNVTKQHLALKVKYENINDNKCLIATGIDISDENSKRKELEMLSKVDKLIIKCANTLLKDSSESLNELMGILTGYYKASRAYIYELSYTTMTAHCIVDFYADENAKQTLKRDIPFDKDLKWTKFLFENDYLFTEDIAKTFGTNSKEFVALEALEISNFLLIPLKKNGKFFGFIGVDDLKVNKDDAKLLTSVSAFVVDSIYKNKALRELEKTKTELDVTFEVSQTLAKCAQFLLEDEGSAKSINQLLKTIAEFYGCEVSYIFELDEEDELKNNYTQVIDNNKFTPLEEIDKETLRSWVDLVKEKNMFFTKDIELLEKGPDYDFLKEVGVNSILLVPLVRDNKVTGLLGCDNLSKNFEQTNLLHILSGFIMNDVEKKELINELEVLSFTDKLTSLYNRNYYLHLIEQHKAIPPSQMGIIFADVNGLKKANDNLGHEYGDILLKWCAKYLKEHLNSSICRIGGDEFVCFCENIPERDFEFCINSMRSELEKKPHQCMSIGSTWSDSAMDINKQIIETDKMMYLEKQHYYKITNKRNLNPSDEISLIKDVILSLNDELID